MLSFSPVLRSKFHLYVLIAHTSSILFNSPLSVDGLYNRNGPHTHYSFLSLLSLHVYSVQIRREYVRQTLHSICLSVIVSNGCYVAICSFIENEFQQSPLFEMVMWLVTATPDPSRKIFSLQTKYTGIHILMYS